MFQKNKKKWFFSAKPPKAGLVNDFTFVGLVFFV